MPAVPALAEGPPQGPVHVALGDSQAFGIGTPRPDKLGYVAALNRRLTSVDCRDGNQAACPHLELVDLSVPGATTSTLITEQLADAVAVIQQRNNDADPDNDVIFFRKYRVWAAGDPIAPGRSPVPVAGASAG